MLSIFAFFFEISFLMAKNNTSEFYMVFLLSNDLSMSLKFSMTDLEYLSIIYKMLKMS